MGMGGPPPKKGGGGALIAIIVGGALAVILVIAVVVVVVVSSGGMTPKERLTAAAKVLNSARTIKYDGSFRAGSDSLRGEITVTKGGSATGAVDWSGDSVTLLSSNGQTFVKASKSYWEDKLTSTASDRFLKAGTQWGRLRDTELSVKFDEDLTPSALASQLRRLSNRYTLEETETTVGGRKAYKLSSTGAATVYLSDDDEPELLRYEKDSSPQTQVDTTVQETQDSSSTIADMRNMMGELVGAIDAGKVTRNSGKPEFVDCKPFGDPCTVRAKIYSTRDGSAPVQVRANFKLTSEQDEGGREFGTCDDTATVTSSSSVTVECTISGGDWAQHGDDYERVWVSVASVAIGATEEDVRRLQQGLDSE